MSVFGHDEALTAGTAGLTAYRAARGKGKSVVIVEGGPYGTTCARVGCMPSKLLIAAAEAAHSIERFDEFGLRLEGKLKVNGKAVMAGATGDFRDQYSQATEALITLLQDNKSIRTGEVIWAGVVAQDPDSATVILATTGTVQNNQTGANPKAENYRIQIQLAAEKGRWLTSDLQFVQ